MSSACPSEVPSAVSSGVDSKASEKTKKPKDPNAPKRPMSSFLMFASENRAAVKEKNPEMTNTELVRELGTLWKSVDHSAYEERYHALMSQYKALHEDYMKANPNPATPEKRKYQKKAKAENSADEAASPVASLESPQADATLAVSPKPVKAQASPVKAVVDPSSEKVPEPSQEAEALKEKKKKKKSKTAAAEAEPKDVTAEAQTATQDEPKPKKSKKSKEQTPSQVSVNA